MPSFSFNNFGVKIENQRALIFLNIIVNPCFLKKNKKQKTLSIILKMAGYAIDREYQSIFEDEKIYYHFQIKPEGIQVCSESLIYEHDFGNFPNEQIFLENKFWSNADEKKGSIEKKKSDIKMPSFKNEVQKKNEFKLDASKDKITHDQKPAKTNKKKVLIEEIGFVKNKFKLKENIKKSGEINLIFDFDNPEFSAHNFDLEVKLK